MATQIGQALAEIRTRIEAAAAHAGRASSGVTLVAVSKTHPADAILSAAAAGQNVFGENRVQEARAKFPLVKQTFPDLRLHLIGALQTNKVEDAVRLADVIESLDRPKLADAIEAAAQKLGRLPRLLVQVNIGDEPQKAGVPLETADAFIETCRARFGEALAGVMAIPPAGLDPVPFFRALAAMRARHGLAWLSMGMSGDFEAAIAEGATHIRVGTAIFGARPAAGEGG